MPDNFEEYNRIVDETWNNIQRLSHLKGGEYAGDQDRLANFRRNANALGIGMETVWAVYAAKHWDAIMQYVKDVATRTNRVRSEPIEGRIDDLIVYLLLFKAIIREGQKVEFTHQEQNVIMSEIDKVVSKDPFGYIRPRLFGEVRE